MSKSRITTLSAQFQLALPPDFCAARHWQPGQEFALVPKEHGVLITPALTRNDLAGLARGANPAHYRDRSDQDG